MRVAIVLAAMIALGGCGEIKEQATLYKPAVAGKPYIAGPGDTVMDLKLTQPLPNAFGRADVFGRSRDAGRVVVRYLGTQDGKAYFSRQDVLIQSNETTMSRSPMPVPTYQTTSGGGFLGNVPVSGSSTTTGVQFIQPPAATVFPVAAGAIQLSAPVGGFVAVEGRKISVLQASEGGLEYSVN